jgi:predicted nucleic acid-binding protein
MPFLLDTSVLSQPLRKNPSAPALSRWNRAGDHACFTSVVCHAEIEWGLLKKDDPARQRRYHTLVRPRLPALPTDPACWQIFAQLKARQFILGEIVADLDLLLAATAHQHDLILATLNKNDFSRVEGLRWEDWSV